MDKPERILISRTDSIGDVILTLPLAGVLKAEKPSCEILFLGKNYTRDVIRLSEYVDEFIDWGKCQNMNETSQIAFIKSFNIDIVIHVFPVKEIASTMKKAGIPQRIGSTGRIYHYLNCNKLVPLSRKKSDLHEAQLNFKLLKPLLAKPYIPAVNEIFNFYGFDISRLQLDESQALAADNKFNLILHPKSKGSAREWPLHYYDKLIELLPNDKYRIYVTGTQEEARLIKPFLDRNKDKVVDMTGKFTLDRFIGFIARADGLIAASTGPLHLAASLGKLSIGLYPPIKPMHPGRWAPIGENASYLVADKNCSDCRKMTQCECMKLISPEQVAEQIEKNG